MSALFCDRPPVAPSLLSACSLPPSIERYFATINAGCFQDTAALFAPTGALFPPFETPITGRDRLTTYLQQEADGMELVPLQAEINDHGRQFAVIGRVKTPLFQVNASWQFVLNARGEIQELHVQLLASLEELLTLRPNAAFGA